MNRRNNSKPFNRKIHYATTIIPALARKAYFTNNFIIENFELSVEKMKEGGVDKIENKDALVDIDINKYDSNQIGIFLRYLESMHKDIGIYGLVSRQLLDENTSWGSLDKFIKYMDKTFALTIDKCESCVLHIDNHLLEKLTGDIICVGEVFTKQQNVKSIEDLGDNKYDAIVLSNYLHHNENIEDILGKVTSNLNKNGKILIEEIDISDNNYKKMFDILHEYQKRYMNGNSNIFNHTVEFIKDTLNNNKFKILEEAQIQKNYYILAEL